VNDLVFANKFFVYTLPLVAIAIDTGRASPTTAVLSGKTGGVVGRRN